MFKYQFEYQDPNTKEWRPVLGTDGKPLELSLNAVTLYPALGYRYRVKSDDSKSELAYVREGRRDEDLVLLEDGEEVLRLADFYRVAAQIEVADQTVNSPSYIPISTSDKPEIRHWKSSSSFEIPWDWIAAGIGGILGLSWLAGRGDSSGSGGSDASTSLQITSSATASINENTGAETVVYTATTNSESVTYSLSGTDAAYLQIDENTGVVTLIEDPDHETQSRYQFNLVARDTNGNQVSQSINLVINDLDESTPVFTTGVTLGNGGFVVTWISYGQNGVYGQRYDSDGAAVGSEFQINTYTSVYQQLPSVTTLMDGGFVVTWSSRYQDGSDFGIYGQRYDADGNAAGSEFQINTYTSNAQYWSSVTALADGGFVVSWDSFQDGSNTGVYGQRYDADGNAAGSEFQINTYTSSYQLYADVASLEDGDFVVTWSSSGQDGDNYGIYGQRYDAEGNAAGSEFQINTYTSSTQIHPSVAGLLDGGFVVIWESYGQDSSYDGIYGQRYDADGNTVGSEFQISTYTSDYQENSSVTALLSGGFVVTWESDNQDGSGEGVYGQLFDADGNTVGSEFLINTTTYNEQYQPSVSALDDGGFVVTWASFQDGFGYGVYGQRFDDQGNTVGSEFQVDTYTNSDQYQPDVAGFVDVFGGEVTIDENAGANQVVYTANATDTLDTDDSTDNSDAVTYSLSGTDADHFSLGASSGELTLLEDPDYETQSSYEVVITATDDSGNRHAQTVTVNVNNILDGPTITSSATASAIDENSGAGQVIYSITSDDPNAVYGLSGDDASLLSVDSSTGEVTLTTNPDAEAKSSYSVDVTATDQYGQTSVQTVTLTVNDLDESAPVITSGASATAIDENSPAGQQVYTITADDSADVSGGVSFSIEGDDASFFSLDSSTGAVTLNDSPDFETQSSYQFDAVATDAAGNRTSKTVSLAINNLVDGPTITSSATAYAIDENTGAGQVIYSITSDDPSAVYGLSGADASLLSVDSSTGEVTLTTNPDAEAKSSYSVDVTATDQYGQTSVQTVTLTVNDLDESAPVFTTGVTLGNGGFVVTWTSYIQDGSSDGVYGQRYDSDGNTVGSEFQINTYTSSTQQLPSVTTLMDGGFVVTWSSSYQEGDGYAVYGQRYGVNGNAAGSEFQINTYSTDFGTRPSVTGLLGGGFVVTWYSHQNGSDFDIYGQRYDADGYAAESEFQINSYTYNWQRFSDIASLEYGGFVVTWSSSGQDGAGRGIYGQRYDADGNTVGNEFQVNNHTSGDQSYPSVTGLLDGGFVVTWDSNNGQDGSNDGIYGQRYDVDGNAIGSEFQINTYTSDDQEYSSVTALLSGGFVVTWESDNQDGSDEGIYGQLFDANGNTVGSEFLINTYTSSNQYQPSVAALDDGGFIVAWSSEDQDGSGYGVYGQRFDTNGNTVGSELQINSYTSSDQDEPDVAGFTTILGHEAVISIDENAGANQVVYTVNATDTLDTDDSTDNSSTVTYSLSGTDADHFSLGASSGELTLLDDPDYETQSRYEVVITATDDSGNSRSQTVTAAVNDLDEVAPLASLQLTEVELATVQLEALNNTSETDADPQITALGSTDAGETGYVVTWSGDNDSIFVQAFNADGSLKGTTQQLEALNNTSGYDRYPKITAVGSDGGYVVTWFGNNSDRGYSTFVQAFNADGSLKGTTQQLGAQRNAIDNSLQITAVGSADASERGYVVTWHGTDSDGDFSIFVQAFNADGSLKGTTQQLSITGFDLYPQITAVGSEGGYVITWCGIDSDEDYSIFVQAFNADGSLKGTAQQLEALNNTSGVDWRPQITAVGSEGGYVVTWYGDDSDGDDSIFVQAFNADGSLKGTVQQLEAVNNTSGYDRYPKIIAVGSDGGYVVTWSGTNSDGELSIFVQAFNADGSLKGTTQQLETLNNTSSYYFALQITAVGSDGSYVVTWYGDDSDGDSSIFVQAFNADGSLKGTAQQLEALNNTSGVDWRPQITAVGSEGGYVVTWSGEDSDGDFSIFVQQFDVADEFQVGESVELSSTESGSLYLVNSSISVTELADITGAASNLWASVELATAGDTAFIDTTGLQTGSYNAYAVDEAGNLSLASATDITLESGSGGVKEDTRDDTNLPTSLLTSSFSSSSVSNTDTQEDEAMTVVFDTSTGSSTSESERLFDANTTYHIYILMADTSVMDEAWSGADNLGEDDRFFVVDSDGELQAQAESLLYADDQYQLLDQSANTLLILSESGEFSLADGSTDVILWNGAASFGSSTVNDFLVDTVPEGSWG